MKTDRTNVQLIIGNNAELDIYWNLSRKHVNDMDRRCLLFTALWRRVDQSVASMQSVVKNHIMRSDEAR